MIDKTKFTPCSMPCTEEQWQELKPYLDRYGVTYKDIDSFKEHPIIANNFSDKAYTISNVLLEARNMNNRTYNSEFSIPFFLKNCGIVDYQEQPKEEAGLEIAVTVTTCKQIGIETWRDINTTKVFNQNSTLKEIDDWVKSIDKSTDVTTALMSLIKH